MYLWNDSEVPERPLDEQRLRELDARLRAERRQAEADRAARDSCAPGRAK